MITEPGTCGSVKERCECVHEKGHKSAHECNCGGQWLENGDIVCLPKIGGVIGELGEMMDTIYGATYESETDEEET